MTSQLKTQPNSMPPVILGSTSPFRKILLEKLHLPFTQDKPEIDESPLATETPKEMVVRLAKNKAQVFRNKYPNHIIIASDQSALFNGKPIGKPKDRTTAIQQLSQFSKQKITFYTAMTVLNTASNQEFHHLDCTGVYFRALSQEVIENYLDIEQPYNCAGSFKSEGLGITLFEKIDSRDPNALIGLPLMALTDIFYEMGYPLPLKQPSETS